MRIANCRIPSCRRKWAILAGLVVVVTLISTGTGYGQSTAESVVAAPLWKVDPNGYGMTLPTTCGPCQDQNGSVLVGNPLLDGRPTGIPGLVFGAEVPVVVPHVTNQLFDTVTRASGASDVVQLPSAQTGGVVMPRFELGYRFGEGTGELLLSYRFLDDRATVFTSLPQFGAAPVPLSSRLSLNTWDADYGSWEPLTFLGVDMKWRVGVRFLLEFNDSQANNSALAQATSNDYFGVGPHAMVDFNRPINGTGFALFSRIESAFVFGHLQQNYSETDATGGAADFGTTTERILGQITSLELQVGLTWTPEWNKQFHVSVGYIFEHYWDLGTIATGHAAREELDINGGFVRLEWNY
jgi:hypothetical protein